MRLNDKLVQVVTNPDKAHLRYLRDNETFIHFDLDRPGHAPGDSGAYYVFKKNPNIVFNFKGDPPFLFHEADPDTYNSIMQQFPELTGGDNGVPFVFRDMRTDRIMCGFYDRPTGHINRIDRITQTNIDAFFQDFGGVPPPIIPQMDLSYTPPEPEGFHPKTRKVNQYIMSDLMRETQTTLMPEAKLEFGYAHEDLKAYCPTICKVIYHVLGSNSIGFERFINWFSFIVQTRNRTETAWILHGVQGTGKGILFNKILAPVLGRDNCSAKDLSNMEDSFNAWTGSKMLVCIDEFRLSNAKNADALEQKIKRLITDEHTTVRAMHTDQTDARSFVNLILSSNYLDVMTIPEGDRRLNVAPRQNLKLLDMYPEFKLMDISPLIEKELAYFAEYTKQTAVDIRMVRDVWENDARRQMQVTTKSTVDEFIEAFSFGNMDYFIPVLEEKALTVFEMDIKIMVDQYIKQMIKFPGQRLGFSAQELATIYNYMHGAKMTSRKFAKMCQHHNMFQAAERNVRCAEDGQLKDRLKCFASTFKPREHDQAELEQMYLKKPVQRPIQH